MLPRNNATPAIQATPFVSGMSGLQAIVLSSTEFTPERSYLRFSDTILRRCNAIRATGQHGRPTKSCFRVAYRHTLLA